MSNASRPVLDLLIVGDQEQHLRVDNHFAYYLCKTSAIPAPQPHGQQKPPSGIMCVRAFSSPDNASAARFTSSGPRLRQSRACIRIASRS